MYEQGFSQVASKYTQLNKEMTNPKNSQDRNVFLKQAMSSLKNLSAMDLSQQQNVETASSVFEPFWKNKNALGDMALTAHWNQQESIADSYRLKDGGKEYSEDNINYVRQQRQKFAQDTPTSWGSYYANKQSYTPYYDYNKEQQDWFKLYKPNTTHLEKVNGMYKVTDIDKSATAQDLKQFFNGVLSDKAKNQMRIEAAVKYNTSNPELMVPLYKQSITNDLKSVNEQIAQIDNAIQINRDKNKNAELKATKQQYSDRADSITSELKKINDGDTEHIKRNAEKIAYTLYSDQIVGKLASGLAYTDKEHDIDGDKVAMMYYVQGQENWRTRFTAAAADARQKKTDLGYDLEGSQFQRPAGQDATVKPLNPIQLSEQIKDNEVQKGVLSNDYKKHIAIVLNKPEGSITDKDVNTYMTSPRGKVDMTTITFNSNNALLQAKTDGITNQLTAHNEYVKKHMGDNYDKIEQNRDYYSRQGSVDGIPLVDIYNSIINGTFVAPTAITTSKFGDPTHGEVTINGKQISSPNGVGNIVKAAERIREASKDILESYKKNSDKYFTEGSTNTNKWYAANDASKTAKWIKGQIAPHVGVETSKIVGVENDGKGGVSFIVDDKDVKADPDKVITNLTIEGLTASYDKTTGRFFARSKPGLSNINFGLDIDAATFNDEKLELLRTGRDQAGDGYISPHFYGGNKQTIYKTDKGEPIPQFYYKVSTNGLNKTYYLYNDIAPTKHIDTYSNLSDLFKDAESIAALWSTGQKQLK